MLSVSRPCRKCLVDKPITLDHYQAIPNSTDGFRKTCRECKSKSDQLRHLANKDKNIARVREWYKNNKDIKQEYDRQYRETNRLKIRAQKKIAWRKLREALPITRLYQNCYTSSRRFEESKRYKITKTDIQKLFVRQRNLCFYCGIEMNTTTGQELDHVIPRIRGGVHSIGNLVATCLCCNREKSHRFITEYKLRKVVLR